MSMKDPGTQAFPNSPIPFLPWYLPPATIILNPGQQPRNLPPTTIGDSVVLQSLRDSQAIPLGRYARAFGKGVGCGRVGEWLRGGMFWQLDWRKSGDLRVMFSATAFTVFVRHCWSFLSLLSGCPFSSVIIRRLSFFFSFTHYFVSFVITCVVLYISYCSTSFPPNQFRCA
ncbi:hypothetical protein L873DRAFT_824998 [Choiromyces venosus 120613-1]|uniref:Uncharacterized protein n=1 Tax=Choiromyces venosus 120613-1 TaxID=1336337 RepID=A0A3N4JU04_9PEZI|nr:hypothetical protein L873DRAFT_824998 [Choiromyces venosus 120613-1]